MTATGVVVILLLAAVITIFVRMRSMKNPAEQEPSLNISEPFNLQHTQSASTRSMKLVPRHCFMPMGTMQAEMAYEMERRQQRSTTVSSMEMNLSSGMAEDVGEIPAPTISLDDV